MVGWYLDASVLVPLVIEKAVSEALHAFLLAPEPTLWVSEFASAEAASALSRLVRMKAITPSAATAALVDLDTWRLSKTCDVELNPSDVRLANLLVRRFETKLRAADALHIAMSKRIAATLISRDDVMVAAAKMIGLEALNPTA